MSHRAGRDGAGLMRRGGRIVATAILTLLAGGASAPAAGQSASPERVERRDTPLSQIAPLPAPESRLVADNLDEAPEDFREALRKAREQYESGQLDEAIDSVANIRPPEGREYYEYYELLARTRIAVERLAEGREAAERAVMLRPERADAHFLLGALDLQERKLESAVAHFRSATLAAERELDNPRVTAAWYQLGRCLWELGYLTAAVESFSRFDTAVWETFPEHRLRDELRWILRVRPRGAFELRRDILRALGRAEDVVALFEWAARTLPENPPRETELVDALLAAGQAERALRLCQERLAAGAADFPLISLIRAAAAAGELDAALQQIEQQHLPQREDPAAARVELARMAVRLEQNEAAMRLWRSVQTDSPEHAEAAWSIALLQRREGRLAEAVETLAAFQRAHPRQPCPGELLERWLREPAEARAVDALLTASPEGERDSATLLALGALAAAGDDERARELLASAAAASSDFAWAHVLLGHLAARRFDWEAVRTHAQAALKIDADLAAGHYLLGVASDGLDENEQAVEHFRRALRHAPRDAACLLALGRHMERTKQALGAQRYYHEALEADPTSGAALEELIDAYLDEQKVEVARTRFEKIQPAEYPPDVIRRIETALQYANGPADEFIVDLAMQFEHYPHDARTGLKLVAAHYYRADFEPAAELMSRVRRSAAADEQTLFWDALVAGGVLDYPRAIESLEQLLERYPNRIYIVQMLAQYRLYDFQLDAAAAAFQRLIELAPDDRARAGYRASLIEAYRQFGEPQAGLKLLDEWSAGGELPAELRDLRLELLIDAGRAEEAIKLAVARMEGEPHNPEHVDLLLSVYSEAEAYDRGIDLLRERIKQDAENRQLVWELVRFLLLAERPDEALSVLREQAAASWDESLERRRWIALAEQTAGRYDAAIQEFRALLAERLVDANMLVRDTVRRLLLNTMVLAQKYDEALRQIDEWYPPDQYATAERRSVVLALKQIVFQAAERTDEYIAVSRELLAGRPADPGLNNDLGYTWVDRGENVERATAMIRRAVAAEPLNAAYLDSLGWALYKQGDWHGARKYLERSIRLERGEDPVVFDHLADVDYRLGHVQGAVERWQQALKLIEGYPPATRRRYEKLELSLKAKLAAHAAGRPVEVAPTATPQE